MSKGQLFKYFIRLGKEIFGTNNKKIADDLARQGGKKVPKNQITAQTNVKKAPSIPNPRVNGKFTKPKPVAPAPKRTTVSKPSAPKSTSPAKPTTPKPPAKPKTSSTAPAKPSGGSTGSRSTGGRGRKKAPLMPKNMVKERPNLPPKPLTSRPALLRDMARPEAPEITTEAPTPKTKPNNKSGEMPKKGKKSSRLDKKGETPKKQSSPRPKLRPAAGPTTNESFGKAFARNRKAGNATFTWKGNKYTTRYKEESIAQHKKKFGVEGKY